MKQKIFAPAAASLTGLLLLFFAASQLFYQSVFSAAYSVQTDKKLDDPQRIIWSQAKGAYEMLLLLPFAGKFLVRYNLAMLAYSRNDYSFDGYNQGMGYLQKALTEAKDSNERAELFYALSWGVVKSEKHFRDVFVDRKQKQLFLLQQSLLANPNHWKAKRIYELLARELQGEEAQKDKSSTRPIPNPQNDPFEGYKEPAPEP